MLIVDGQLDLAFSALAFGRNLSLPLEAVISAESKWARPYGPPTTTISTLLQGGSHLIMATLFPMPTSANRSLASAAPRLFYPDDAPPDYRQNAATEAAMIQYDYYRRLADEDSRVRLVKTASDLAELQASVDTEDPLVGIIMQLKGAEAIAEPAEVERWVEMGVYALALAWDDTIYAPGQWRERGRLPDDGFALLERMGSFNMLCDITHLSEEAAWQVLEAYDGTICASHANAAAIVPGEQNLSNAQLRAIGERDGVIGISLQNNLLRKRHAVGDRKALVTLDHVIAHIDHICQLLGDASHVGIGSGMAGRYGGKELPTDIENSADLSKIALLLSERGYESEHISAIMHGNWLRLFSRVLPQSA